MTSDGIVRSGGSAAQNYGSQPYGGHEPSNLGDILERVLDKGLVIAGDIRVNLLDIELLTIKLRLVVASVQTARELGIDWWEKDPWLTSGNTGQHELEEENRRLRDRLAELEGGDRANREVDAGGQRAERAELPGSRRGDRGAGEDPGS